MKEGLIAFLRELAYNYLLLVNVVGFVLMGVDKASYPKSTANPEKIKK